MLIIGGGAFRTNHFPKEHNRTQQQSEPLFVHSMNMDDSSRTVPAESSSLRRLTNVIVTSMIYTNCNAHAGRKRLRNEIV